MRISYTDGLIYISGPATSEAERRSTSVMQGMSFKPIYREVVVQRPYGAIHVEHYTEFEMRSWVAWYAIKDVPFILKTQVFH